MKIKGWPHENAPDVSRLKTLKLTAHTFNDERFLAVLLSFLTTGGHIAIETDEFEYSATTTKPE